MKLKIGYIIAMSVAIIGLQIAVMRFYIGQPLICPCGYLNLWGKLRSPEDSQMFLDWYSLFHLSSGFFLYFAFFLVRKKLGWPQVKVAFLLVLIISFCWKIYENKNYAIYDNSPLYSSSVYQYHGDSLVNSTMDTLLAAAGFGLAYYLPVQISFAAVAIIEIILAIAVHDSMIISLIMTVHPVKWLASYQQAVNYPP